MCKAVMGDDYEEELPGKLLQQALQKDVEALTREDMATVLSALK